MRFCPRCQNRMGRRTSGAAGVEHVCPIDFTVEPGRPVDLRLRGGGGADHSARVASLHRSTLQHAARDPATARVARPCPDCKLPYLRQVIVGEDAAAVFFLCDCGWQMAAKDYDEELTSEALLKKLADRGDASVPAPARPPAAGESESKGEEA